MKALPKIQVLLAQDHAVVRQGLCTLLQAEGRVEVVGQAPDGREAVRLAALLQPDVILMDIAMPILNGLEATRQILAARPGARVLILSAHSDDEYSTGSPPPAPSGFSRSRPPRRSCTRPSRRSRRDARSSVR